MVRIVLAALVFAIATATALAQSTRFKLTDCGEVVESGEIVENCGETFLKGSSLERRKAMLQEFKKQQDDLNKTQPSVGVKSGAQADSRK